MCGVSRLGCWDPRLLEANAILFGMQLVLEYNCADIVVENDSLGVIKAIKCKEEGTRIFHLILDNIIDLAKSFNSCFWCFVGRVGNKVAHSLAHLPPWDCW